MNPTIFGGIGPGFLNRVPTLTLLMAWGLGFRVFGLGLRLGLVVFGLGFRSGIRA